MRDCRPAMDEPNEQPLEHHVQNHLHWRAGLHDIPHAQRLQADARSKSGYLQGRISDRRSCGDGDTLSIQICLDRGKSENERGEKAMSRTTDSGQTDTMGILNLAGIRCDSTTAIHAAKNR